MKRKEKTNKDCQNDRVPSLTLFYLHVVSYINLFVLFYLIFLHSLFFSVCPNKLSWLNVKKLCVLMYLKFICRLWLQLWHFFLDMMKKTKIKKTVIVIKRLAKSLHLFLFVFNFFSLMNKILQLKRHNRYTGSSNTTVSYCLQNWIL